MTFNNNNNRRCLDLLAAIATGIRQRLLLCWWCPQKNRGANWLCLWDRPVFIALVATSAALNFIRKDKLEGSHLLLLAQSLCEIHCQFVYPIQNRLCLGEKCLFVVQTLIKIRISSSVFVNRLCMLFYSLFISLCNFDYSVYVYCKHPLSYEAWQWGGGCGNLLRASQRMLLLFLWDWLLLFWWSSNSPKPSSVVVVDVVWFIFSWNGSWGSSAFQNDQ